jgi:hypothetical protein
MLGRGVVVANMIEQEGKIEREDKEKETKINGVGE